MPMNTMTMGFVILFFVSSANSNPPPSIPTFTKLTVRQMLSSIDQKYNFTLLRVVYFGGHIKSSFPSKEGFKVLKGTLVGQKKGSAKWFLLESLRGFAGFHSPDIPTDEGFDAYELIFDNAKLATTSRPQAAVHDTVRGFVSTIPTIIDRKGWDTRFASLLLNAWQTWHTIPLPDIDRRNPLDWSRAVKAADAQDKFLPIVEAALKDTTHAPDFAMLKLAVVVLQDEEPKRAIDLLRTAQKKMEPGDLNQQKWLYETWAQLITGNDPKDQLAPKVTDKTQLAALAEMRKDQISYTGHGYADLLKLYWQLGQNDKAAELIKVMNGPGISVEEKIDVAKVLLSPPRDLTFDKDAAKQMQAKGVDLLEKYLAAAQEIPLNPPLKRGTLEVRNELQAHYLLGRYYLRNDMITEADKALQTGALKPPFHDSQSAAYYDQIQQLRAALEKKLAGVEGVR